MADDYLDDCAFARGGCNFRYHVGAIIIEDGCVLMVTNDNVDFYYSVGGGVHLGETSEQAACREAREETGRDYEIDRLAFIHESFFYGKEKQYNGGLCHEIALFYLMKPLGSKETHCESLCPSGKERVEWLDINSLSNIKLFPRFFVDRLKDIPETVQHIVEDERKLQ